MTVNTDVSDLFFNTKHKWNEDTENYPEIGIEARDFLDALDRLGVSTPSWEDLIADFYSRR